MQKQKTQQCRVSPEESGQKLFAYLKRKLGREFPTSGVMRLIRTGQVRVNSRRSKPYARVFTGDKIRIPPHVPEQGDDPSRAGELDIVFENRNLLVLNKPSGIPVHSGTSARRDNMVLRLRKHYSGADFTPNLVHRLDKDTSGLLLVAKNYHWLQKMHRLWKQGEVSKTYLAWIHGKWQKKGWVKLEHRLARKHEKVISSPDEGKTALTWVQAIVSPGPNQDMTLVMVRIATGRTHQIRAQLALAGHPVAGDGKYGSDFKAFGRMLLHAYCLAWPGYDFRLRPDWDDPFAPPEDIRTALITPRYG